jgi:hypothetical protein
MWERDDAHNNEDSMHVYWNTCRVILRIMSKRYCLLFILIALGEELVGVHRKELVHGYELVGVRGEELVGVRGEELVGVLGEELVDVHVATGQEPMALVRSFSGSTVQQQPWVS